MKTEVKTAPIEPKPQIFIPCNVWEKIMFWVNKADFEVSGFGKCHFNGKDFEVTSAILLKQKGGSTHTDIDPESLSKAQYLLKDEPGELRFWWHSHVDMPTFMSLTDQQTLTELGKNGWAIASVFNKRQEITSSMCYATPFGSTHSDYEISTMVTYPALTEAEKAECEKSYGENVSKESWADWGKSKNTPQVYDATERYKPQGFTYFEKECAEALGLTPKQFKKTAKRASKKELQDMKADIFVYWSDKRGYHPYDHFGDYPDLSIDEDDDDKPLWPKAPKTDPPEVSEEDLLTGNYNKGNFHG